MKVEGLNTVLTDLHGEKLKLPPLSGNGESVDATASDVIYRSLVFETRSDSDATSKDKYERFNIAKKVVKAADGELNLTTAEWTIVKDRVGKMFTPLVVGAIFDLIEGTESTD